MNKELREKIIAYNKSRKIEQEAYKDFIKLIEPLKSLKKILPTEIQEILRKYEGNVK